MIPKIIHYTWFSGDPFPPLIKQCIDSWHKYLPDYSFVCWDSARIKEIQSIWLEETLSVRKWAFASDGLQSVSFKYLLYLICSLR